MSVDHDANNQAALRKTPEGVFVTGSSTNVGKTYVSQILIRQRIATGQRVGAYKPAASGTEDGLPSDFELLWQATGRLLSLDAVCPQRFQAPLAPCLAAEKEGRSVDETLLVNGLATWTGHCDFVLIEGAGGLLSPVSWQCTNADLAAKFGYPLVVVVANVLGAVNQALLTLAYAQSRNLQVNELIFSDIEPSPEGVFDQHLKMLRAAAPHTIKMPLPVIRHLRHGATQFT
jgi:dethiobiotin synthetase